MSLLRDDILVYVENPKEKVPTTNTWVKEGCKFKSKDAEIKCTSISYQ